MADLLRPLSCASLAYEAGVIAGLLQNLPASETSYDVVTGISAGSTLTAAFSVFDIGQEQQVADFAYSIIKDLNQSAIFRMWPGGLVQGLLQEASIFDSTPLRDLFTSVLADKTLSTDRVTCMGATELNSGAFVRFCEHESLEAVVNATISSAAIPGVFLDQTWSVRAAAAAAAAGRVLDCKWNVIGRWRGSLSCCLVPLTWLRC